MAGPTKMSTCIVGLKVVAEPRKALLDLYGKTLSALALLPKESAYRQHTENLTNERMAMVEKETDVGALEEKINCGQIEEVIVQAQDELSLAQKFADWKPHESLQYEAPPGQWDWP